MYYKKLNVGETIIEFHNNWLGEETVIANGQMVSKKSSIWGTTHHFSLMEDGNVARYILVTKVGEMMNILIDLSKNGKILYENEPVGYGFRPKDPSVRLKKEALTLLNDYDLKAALDKFEEVAKIRPRDPEIYFHKACAYSVMENVEEGFACLKAAVDYGLANTDAIMEHDMLAYLRMHEGFQGFFESNFTKYDLNGDVGDNAPD